MRTILAASAIFVAVLLGCLNASGNSQDKSPQAAKGAPLQITTPDKVESRIGPLAFTDGIPTENTAEKVYDHLDYIRGVDTFLNSFSGVSMYSIRKGFRDAGVADNSVLIFSELMDSKSLFLTANCDTVYFWGYLDLSKGPMVVEVPAGSLGVFNDIWFRWIADFGTPGADRGEGGKYLLLPPGYAGPVPGGGFYVGRSRTNGAALIGRAFLEKDDPRPVAEHIKKNLKIYPYAPGGQGTSIADFLQGKAKLGPPATPTPAKFVEGSGRAMNTIPPNDVTFYDVLNALVQEEPASALEPELAGQFAAIGIIKGKPFQPDARLKKILVEALAMGNAASRVIGTRARPEEGFQYYGKESAWSNPLFAGGSEFKTPPPLVTKEGIKPFPDTGARKLDARTSFFYLATVVTPAMCMNLTNIGSQYLGTFYDSKGMPLDGAMTYKLVLPKGIPAAKFWSVTLYDNQTRSMLQTAQRFPRAGSQTYPTPAAVAEADDSTVIYIGPKRPDGAKDGNWIQTVPGRGWFVLLRLYSPLEPFFDKTWRPGEFVEVK